MATRHKSALITRHVPGKKRRNSLLTNRKALPVAAILRKKDGEGAIEQLPLHLASVASGPPESVALARELAQHRGRRRLHDGSAQARMRTPAVVDVVAVRPVESDRLGVREAGRVAASSDEIGEDRCLWREGGRGRRHCHGRRRGHDSNDAGSGWEETEPGGARLVLVSTPSRSLGWALL